MILSVEHSKLRKKYIEHELEQLPKGKVKTVHTHGYRYDAVWLPGAKKYYSLNSAKGRSLLEQIRRSDHLSAELDSIDAEIDQLRRSDRIKSEQKRRNEPLRMDSRFFEKLKESADSNPYPKPDNSTEHNGILMRSKGEKIIAQQLDSLGYEYTYESCVWIDRFVYPDFAVYIPEIDKVVFIEFMGAVDDPRYSAGAKEKFADFTRYGYIPGRDIIFICETGDSIADMDILKAQLNAVIMANSEVIMPGENNT